MALAEQSHGMGFGLGVYAHFGLEVDAHAHDIFGGVEVGGGGGSGGFETDLERAQTIHVDCFGIGKGVGENLLELAEHGDHVGVLGGTVVLNQIGHVLGLHRVDVERTSIPFTLVGTILAELSPKCRRADLLHFMPDSDAPSSLIRCILCLIRMRRRA
jgi:hypothetical protein